MSCGAACARQLLLDAGIDVPEARLRELTGFDPDQGIMPEALAEALNELHPGVRYRAGSVGPEQLPALAKVVPFIALLRTPSTHFVIVQDITETEVYIRDPAGVPDDAPVGREGVLNKAAFVERWTRAINRVIFRCG